MALTMRPRKFPPGLPDEEFRHDGCTFYSTANKKSHYAINPEWVSERTTLPSFGGRTSRPWAYEYQGARQWPYFTVENRERVVNNLTKRTQSAYGYNPKVDRRLPASYTGMFVRRPESASLDLNYYEQEEVHPSTLMSLTERQSKWLSNNKRWATTEATPISASYDQQYSTSYKDHFMKGTETDPYYAEYLDHEAIPPSKPRIYRDMTPDRMTPVHQVMTPPPPHARTHPLPALKPNTYCLTRPYVNVVGLNFVR